MQGFCYNESFIDENFVRRMLSTVDAQVASYSDFVLVSRFFIIRIMKRRNLCMVILVFLVLQAAIPGTRNCGSTQEHAIILDHSKSSSNQLEMQNVTSLAKSNGTNRQRTHKGAKQKIMSKAKHSRIYSTISTTEEQLPESFAIHDSTTIAPDQGKRQLSSSCDSASTKPSLLDSQNLSKDAEIRDWMPQPATCSRLADQTKKISKNHVDTCPVSMVFIS